MKTISHNSKPALIIICSVAILLLSACIPVHANGPHISLVEAQYSAVYPQGKTELTCTASSPGGEALTYTWVCTEGTITGSGEKVTWKAPNKYGEFPIMVTVTDTAGNKDSASFSIKVVVNENPQTNCPYCRR
jgi:FlaG/FlaF family flagellin (archaellin)